MKPESISAIAAVVSALSALITNYLYRKQNKGFVWAKDQKIHFNSLPDGNINLAVEIPLFNCGSGNIEFKKLIARKIHLKTNSVDPFEVDMDQAYFPPGVLILAYRTPVYSDDKTSTTPNLSTQVRIHRFEINPEQIDGDKLQNEINKKLDEFGEVVFILKAQYRDGSWFGWHTKTTTIAMSLRGLDLSFLSTKRRKELDQLFK